MTQPQRESPHPATREVLGMRIGTLASKFGLNPKTIRYYEAIGLLPQPRRSPSGYRLYDAATRDQLRFITKAKQVGLTLAEIGEILALWRDHASPCAHLVAIVDHKLAALDEQLRVQGEFRRELAALREEASRGPDGAGAFCRAIEHHASPATRTQGRRA